MNKRIISICIVIVMIISVFNVAAESTVNAKVKWKKFMNNSYVETVKKKKVKYQVIGYYRYYKKNHKWEIFNKNGVDKIEFRIKKGKRYKKVKLKKGTSKNVQEFLDQCGNVGKRYKALKEDIGIQLVKYSLAKKSKTYAEFVDRWNKYLATGVMKAIVNRYIKTIKPSTKVSSIVFQYAPPLDLYNEIQSAKDFAKNVLKTMKIFVRGLYMNVSDLWGETDISGKMTLKKKIKELKKKNKQGSPYIKEMYYAICKCK